jgi:serine/threonine protein phosphatase PrpC
MVVLMGVTMTVFGATDPGSVRGNNEDSFVVVDLTKGEPLGSVEKAVRWDVGDRGILIGVSDGMGGEQAGEVASAMVVSTLREKLQEILEQGDDDAQRVKKAVDLANAEVFKAAQEPGKKGMGATLTAALVRGGTAFIVEVGDSRAYLLRGANLRQITRDQSYAQLLVDSGVLKPEDVANFQHKNMILQAMGKSPEIVAGIGKLALRRGDRLLLCSDGLHGMVKDSEMRDVLLKAPTLDDACKNLIKLANDRGGEDNITVVLAEVSGQDLPAATANDRVTLTLEAVQEFNAADAQVSPFGREEPDPTMTGPVMRPLPIPQSIPPPKLSTRPPPPEEKPSGGVWVALLVLCIGAFALTMYLVVLRG